MDAYANYASFFFNDTETTETRFETRRKADLATIQQAAEYYEKQMNRWLVASNDTRAGQ
jgi:hypothetical protein